MGNETSSGGGRPDGCGLRSDLSGSGDGQLAAEGTYECTIGGLYADELKITGKDTYKRFGKKGEYKAGSEKIAFDDGVAGYKIKFKTGPFKDFKGRWHKVESGTGEIALKNPIDGFEDTYCDES